QSIRIVRQLGVRIQIQTAREADTDHGKLRDWIKLAHPLSAEVKVRREGDQGHVFSQEYLEHALGRVFENGEGKVDAPLSLVEEVFGGGNVCELRRQGSNERIVHQEVGQVGSRGIVIRIDRAYGGRKASEVAVRPAQVKAPQVDHV